MFFYKVFEHSFLATFINVVFRLIAFLAIILSFTVFNDESRVLRLVIIAIGITFWCVGNVVGVAVAAKAEEKVRSKRMGYESKLCLVELDSTMEPEELSYPATITIVRDKVFMYHIPRIEYIVNDNTYMVMKEDKVNIVTMQKSNTVISKGSEEEPYRITVKSGEQVILHFKGIILVGVERLHRDGSRAIYFV